MKGDGDGVVEAKFCAQVCGGGVSGVVARGWRWPGLVMAGLSTRGLFAGYGETWRRTKEGLIGTVMVEEEEEEEGLLGSDGEGCVSGSGVRKVLAGWCCEYN